MTLTLPTETETADWLRSLRMTEQERAEYRELHDLDNVDERGPLVDPWLLDEAKRGHESYGHSFH